MKIRIVLLLCALAVGLVASGCATPGTSAGAPNSFRRGQASQWIVFEVKEGMTHDEVWNRLFAILAKRYDIEVFSKEDGYIRTSWMSAGGTGYGGYYHARAVAMVSLDGKMVEMKTEAEYLIISGMYALWVSGVDDEVTETLKTDIMGTIARTTR